MPTGTVGNGAVHTSSPGSSSAAGTPASVHTSTAVPSIGPVISPARNGRVGSPPTNTPTRSVPPEIGLIMTSGPTCSASHSAVGSDSGDPVTITDRTGASPMWSRRTACSARIWSSRRAPSPTCVARDTHATSNRAADPGYVGAPSCSTNVAPTARQEISQFHIIQLVVV